MNHDPVSIEARAPTFWRSRYAVGLIFFGTLALYFLLAEHQAHFFLALPFLLLLACPLMHVFMHHGHGHHAAGDTRRDAGGRGPIDSPVPRAPGTGDQA